MTTRNSASRPLTDLQQAILDFLWARGPATSEQIREGLRAAHPLSDSAMRTILRRLEARALLTHTNQGKVFIYRARVPSRSLAARAVRQVIDRFCEGSVDKFLVGMVDEKVLSLDEIERLARKVKKTR